MTEAPFHDHHVHKPIGWDGDRPLDCVIDGEPWPCSVTRRFQDIGSIEAVVVHKTAPAAAERPQP